MLERGFYICWKIGKKKKDGLHRRWSYEVVDHNPEVIHIQYHSNCWTNIGVLISPLHIWPLVIMWLKFKAHLSPFHSVEKTMGAFIQSSMYSVFDSKILYCIQIVLYCIKIQFFLRCFGHFSGQTELKSFCSMCHYIWPINWILIMYTRSHRSDKGTLCVYDPVIWWKNVCFFLFHVKHPHSQSSLRVQTVRRLNMFFYHFRKYLSY